MADCRNIHKLSEGEAAHVAKRRLAVQETLEKNGIRCKVPTVALIGSGGGARAMVGLLGSVCQLQKEGLLDYMTYLSGVSGSTWCMASLYKEENWSKTLGSATDVSQAIVNRLSGDKLSWAAVGEKLKKYYKDHKDNFSLTHFWAAFGVTTWVKEIDETCLSALREKHDMDPYPIFTVIDKGIKQRKGTKASLKDVWVEMTPHVAGYSLRPGKAFVDQENVGCEFDNGDIMEDIKEMDMLYIQGMCGSALGDGQVMLQEIWKIIKEAMANLLGGSTPATQTRCFSLQQERSPQEEYEVLQNVVEINLRASNNEDYSDVAQELNKLLKDKRNKTGQSVVLQDPMRMERSAAVGVGIKKYTVTVCDCLTAWYPKEQEELRVSSRSYSTWGQGVWDYSEYLKIFRKTIACVARWKWGSTNNFLNNMQALGSSEVDHAILESETRNYIDAGLELNSPYFSVLRPERDVDVIISLDFSAGDPMMTVRDASKMAKEMSLDFPHVQISPTDEDRPDDCYVFQPKKQEDTKTPTVIHMPLFNKVNCGDDLEEMREKYTTMQGAYSPEMIKELMEKAAKNVENNAHKLWEAIGIPKPADTTHRGRHAGPVITCMFR